MILLNLIVAEKGERGKVSERERGSERERMRKKRNERASKRERESKIILLLNEIQAVIDTGSLFRGGHQKRLILYKLLLTPPIDKKYNFRTQ
jgi:hypothetical protein